MATWEKVLIAILAGGLIYWMWPRMRYALENSPRGKQSDWLNLVFILGFVVLFVALMMAMV